MVAGETDGAHREGDGYQPTEPADTDRVPTLPPTAPIEDTSTEVRFRSATPLGSRYVLDSEIGSGATGRVWRGRRRADDAPVAVKVLREELTRDPDLVVRFLRQRTVLRSLDHPHLVRVHDLVAEGEVLAVVMDLVDGEDLRRLARTRTLGTEQTLVLLGQVTAALAAVHAAGVVHRDVKPENVLVSWRDGTPRALVTDFGLAGAAAGPTDITRMSLLMGTPAYVAPELVAGRPAVPATDVYALGVMAYELLAGERPFQAPNTAALLRAHLDTDPVRSPRLAEPVWDLLRGMLAKDPAARPTAEAVALELARLRVAERLPPPIPPPPPPPPGGSDLGSELSSIAASVAGTGHATALPTTGATRPATPAASPPAPRRRRGSLVMAIVTVALLGVGAGLWFGRPETPAAPPSSVTSQPPQQNYHLHVTATSPQPGQISLDWDPVHTIPGFGLYIVFRDGTTIADGADLANPHLVPGLDDETNYCWYVIAVVFSATPPPTPYESPKETCKRADGN